RSNPQAELESALTMVLSQRDGTLAISDATLPFHVAGGIRPVAVGDVDRDGRSDLLYLDPRGTDLDELIAGNTTAPIRFDLVTAVSGGGEGSAFVYRRQETEWTYIRQSMKYPELAAADVNGDGRSDFLAMPHGGNGEYPFSIQVAIAQTDGSFVISEQPVPS